MSLDIQGQCFCGLLPLCLSSCTRPMSADKAHARKSKQIGSGTPVDMKSCLEYPTCVHRSGPSLIQVKGSLLMFPILRILDLFSSCKTCIFIWLQTALKCLMKNISIVCQHRPYSSWLDPMQLSQQVIWLIMYQTLNIHIIFPFLNRC